MSAVIAAGKLLLPWGKVCVRMNHKVRLVVHTLGAAARVACPETGTVNRGQKSQ